MCIEVFHPELPIVIRYASETVRFTSPNSIEIVYACLVENAGNLPIEYLNVLSSRKLYFKDSEGWYINSVRNLADETSVHEANENSVRDIAEEIPVRLRDCQPVEDGKSLELQLPDPNCPQFNLPPLKGEWIKNSPPLAIPADAIRLGGLSLLDHLECSYLRADFQKTPLNSWASRWFCWKVCLKNVGIVKEKTPLGRVAIHQIASPCTVRRTFEEKIEIAQRDAEKKGPAWLAKLCVELRQAIGITGERRVTIDLYDLVVQPGPPTDRILMSWDVERDLRMRSGSPKLAGDPVRELEGELLYEWKTGSLLSPDRNPWRNDGFNLHLTIACR